MHNSHVSRSGRTMAQRRKHILHTFYNYGGNLNLHFTLNVWDLLIISSRRSSPRSSKPTLIVREMETKMWENSANRKWKREPGIFFHVTRTQPLRKLCRHGDSQDITAAWNVSMMSHCAVQIAAKSGCLRGDIPPRKRISFTRDTKFSPFHDYILLISARLPIFIPASFSKRKRRTCWLFLLLSFSLLFFFFFCFRKRIPVIAIIQANVNKSAALDRGK